jgi:hypothetical protein
VPFQATDYGPPFADLLRDHRLAPLGPGTPDTAAQKRLEALDPVGAFLPHSVLDSNMARACLAGLWLYHDFLNESHEISQEIDTATGSYWHGMMHRRELDYGNAGYWFRRVGEHPIFVPLVREAARIAGEDPGERDSAFLARQATWDPFAFIRLCEAAHGTGTAAETLCRQVQQREWELLFDYCYRSALGREGNSQ